VPSSAKGSMGQHQLLVSNSMKVCRILQVCRAVKVVETRISVAEPEVGECLPEASDHTYEARSRHASQADNAAL
jgi:hypothetical protein